MASATNTCAARHKLTQSNFLQARLQAIAFLPLFLTCYPAGAEDEATPPTITTSETVTTENVLIPGHDAFSILPGYALPPRSFGTVGRGFTLSGIYTHPLNNHFGLELNVNGSTFETGPFGGTDFYQYGLAADAVYRMVGGADPILSPFVLLGVGGLYDDLYPNARDGAAFMAEGGIGVVSRLLFSNRVRFRFDARWVRDFKEGGQNEYRLLAGFQIPLGSTEREIEHRVIQTQLPPKIEVHEREIVEVVRAQSPPEPDHVDPCAGIANGMRVDAEGCVVPAQTIELQDVTFEFNQARLTLAAEAALDGIAKTFVGQPSLKAEVGGHTDSVGSSSANQLLSQRRAEAVAKYLISKGVHSTQLTAHGYGKSQPKINPETNDRDRERNRRVELTILSR